MDQEHGLVGQVRTGQVMSAQNRSQGKLTVARAKAIHVLRKDRPTTGAQINPEPPKEVLALNNPDPTRQRSCSVG